MIISLLSCSHFVGHFGRKAEKRLKLRCPVFGQPTLGARGFFFARFPMSVSIGYAAHEKKTLWYPGYGQPKPEIKKGIQPSVPSPLQSHVLETNWTKVEFENIKRKQDRFCRL